jgi:quercetin dioxygenase-like cupin family protein
MLPQWVSYKPIRPIVISLIISLSCEVCRILAASKSGNQARQPGAAKVRKRTMQVFKLADEAEFNPAKHVEKILGRTGDGDFTVACWEPGQISPYHCHPDATEIYFCFEGGGVMRTPRETIDVKPGAFVVHPPGEVHEYANGPQRTLLFRVRYGADMRARHFAWRGRAGWTQSADDAEYYRSHPVGG